MNKSLINEFMTEEAIPEIRLMLIDAIGASNAIGTREYTFNRFNVRFDFEARQVIIEDDLTVGPDGEHQLSFDEFRTLLQHTE